MRVFGSSLTVSAFDRNPKDLTRIWPARNQINSSVINPGALKAVARKQIQHD